MPLEAPERSALGFYFESLLQARGGAGQQPQPPVKPEPYPIPDRQTYCLAADMWLNVAQPCGPPTQLCPGDPPSSITGDWRTQYLTLPHCIPAPLVPQNYPIVHGTDSFPAGCLGNWNAGFNYIDGAIIRTLAWDASRVGSFHNACSVGTLGYPAQGTIIDLSIATARWNIVSVDHVNDRLYLDGPTYLQTDGPGGLRPRIAVSGQPQNNGYYLVDIVNDTENWIQVNASLTAEAGAGQVTFQPAILTVCGAYTQVIDACQSIRISCNPAGVALNMHFVFYDSAVYDSDPLPITGIGVDYIEVLSPFNGNDSGDWGAGLWGFNDRGARKTGNFTAVTDPPNVFQAEVRAYTGPELVASEPDDTLLRISNSVGYDGDQSVTPEKPFTTPLWTYNTQLYIGDSAGDWQNRAVVLVGGFFISGKSGRVTGTLGLYDGLYPFVRSAPTGNGGVIANTPFVGTDDGVIEFQGLSFLVNNMPVGYDQTGATVVIAGTGQYDGTYTGCHVFDTGFGFGAIEEGTLDDVWYQGDVTTGTWEVTTGTPANGTIAQSFGDDPDPFTSVEPEKSGSFTSTNCLGIRVNVGAGHGILVGDYFEMFSNAVYTSLCFGTVDAVAADYIDIDAIIFEGNDTGLWNATEPIL